jgi:glycosyltransferase involved in cell wall biosynthesis
MKKLVYIANNRMPAERAYSSQIMSMCMEFAELCSQRNWNFELVIPRRYLPAGEDVFSYHGFEKKFNVVYLACYDAIHLIPQLGQLAYWLQSITFVASLLLWRLKQTDKITVYTREIYISAFFSQSAYEMHTIPERASWLLRRLLRRCTYIIAITHGMKRDLISLGCDAERILVASDGIDLERFGNEISKESARRDLVLPVDKFIVVYAGSFFQHLWKGVTTLLSAAKKLDHETHILFIFVGGHPEEIDAINEGLKNYENIKLVEHSPFQVVRKYLAAADVLVIPNNSGYRVSNHYTSPLKLFEYMAAQRLIVASDLPSIKEIISEESAVFFEPNNVDDLSSVLQNLSHNYGLHKQKVFNSFNLVKSYTWKKRAERILGFLDLH